MLTSLYAENIALIKRLTIDFETGFHAFTGETGAGKSMIIGSIGFVTGNRMDKDLIRAGEESALVSCVFEQLSRPTLDALAELDITPDEDGTIMVSRSMNVAGKSKVLINGRPYPLSVLKSAAPHLINLCGQHDNQKLLDPAHHLSVLDAFCGNDETLQAYRKAYDTYKDIQKQCEALSSDLSDKQSRVEFLQYQIAEIKAAKLRVGEEEALRAERTKLQNLEKIVSSSSAIYETLNGERSVADGIGRAVKAMEMLVGILPEAQDYLAKLQDYRYEIIDMADTVAAYADTCDEEPGAALDRIESRLDVIATMKKKYGGDEAAVLKVLDDKTEELDSIVFSDEKKAKLQEELAAAKDVLESAADALYQTRVKGAELLSKRICDELSYLDMDGVSFEVTFLPTETYSKNGKGTVSFYVSTNKNEPSRPLADIASGGELSRLMLAINNVLAEKDGVGTLIFDEIDTGISGSTSRKIGYKLKESSANA